jgi:hypothetical protein
MLAILFPLLAQSAFLSRSSTRSAAEETSGLSDVIAVLNGMMEAFGKMVTEDNTNWGNYEKLNDGQQADKTAFVQGMKSQVLTCEGQKSAAEGRVTALTNALTQLATDLGEARGSITEITNMRNSEHATHQAEVADLTKTIAAVNNAVTILSSHYDQAGLAQVRKTLSRAMQIAEIEKLMTADQIHALTIMVQQGPDYLSDTQKNRLQRKWKPGGRRHGDRDAEDDPHDAHGEQAGVHREGQRGPSAVRGDPLREDGGRGAHGGGAVDEDERQEHRRGGDPDRAGMHDAGERRHLHW